MKEKSLTSLDVSHKNVKKTIVYVSVELKTVVCTGGLEVPVITDSK